jgi:hypothetical protein
MRRFGLLRTVAFAAVTLALASAPPVSFAQHGFRAGGGFYRPIYRSGFHAGYHGSFYGGHGSYWGHPVYAAGISFRVGFGFGFGSFWGGYPYWFGYGPSWGPPAYYFPYAPYYYPAPNYPNSPPEYHNPGSQHRSAPPDPQTPDTDDDPPEPSSEPTPELPDQDDIRIYSTDYRPTVPSPYSSRQSGRKYQLTSYHNEQLPPKVSRSVQNAFQTLRAMPPSAQQRWLNSGRFTPEHRKLLQTAFHLPQEN